MATLRQKINLAGDLGMFMLEEGKVFTQNEYRSLSRRAPIRFVQIRRYFGNWAACLVFLSKTQPDLWAELENLSKPKVPASIIDLSAIEDEDEEYLER
jgi:hypothetical protein